MVEPGATMVEPGAAAEVGNFVGGRWTGARGSRVVAHRNPANLDEVVSRAVDSDEADAHAAVAAAADAFTGWRALGPVRRGEIVLAVAGQLRSRRAELARAVTREHGKLLREATAEVDRAVAVLEFAAGEGRRLGGVTAPADEPRTYAFTTREPIGVVALITPWNFPLAIPAWKVGPALVAGCTAVLKPSPLTPLTAALLVECFEAAGLPPGVLNLVHGDRPVGEALVKDPDVAGVSFTGSVEVGRAVHTLGAPRFLKTQLEMGGKNAALVLRDADLDLAADAIVAGAFGQAGQRCSATSRAVVERSVHGALLERLVARVAALRVGDGFDPETDVGPVISDERLRACLDSVRQAERDGASVAVGGRPRDDVRPRGHYLAPTVLDGVRPDDFVAQQEIFGPVLSVLVCDDADDGIRIVNGVRYGMAAAIFTADVSRAFDALGRIEAGMLHVNRPGVGAYPHLPHVGTKDSQYGPPECSPQTFDFYTQWRTACVSY